MARTITDSHVVNNEPLVSTVEGASTVPKTPIEVVVDHLLAITLCKSNHHPFCPPPGPRPIRCLASAAGPCEQTLLQTAFFNTHDTLDQKF